ncbi:MAG TPA: DUF934 domain-containing protein [Hypericibacter adhaerens]|jgi:uncharacterized protein (DUF934 family)|uniref:Oxidoreductase n=1 Tax=Hypericibacter adhaerens TaxID=2602016 RepID=A0A5J6MSG6_9PROT|nr:DUF934 domain-containing protein [Hypericibacter adhaerens]QEX20518.1 oxidoreductase [Hypericibacter adhaerens]HWA42985.1 DUF934 domain-containing protein [Hypericibacter adhaerens]
MPLLKHGRVVDDPWHLVGDDDPLPAEGPVVVTLKRWTAEREALLARGWPLGVRLEPADLVETLVPDLARLELIEVDFPKFNDGRGYSTARLLRQRYRYAGELRAVGRVLRDQLLYLHRCGFDAFEIAREDAVETWIKAVSEFGAWYQRGADDRQTVNALRHRRAS